MLCVLLATAAGCRSEEDLLVQRTARIVESVVQLLETFADRPDMARIALHHHLEPAREALSLVERDAQEYVERMGDEAKPRLRHKLRQALQPLESRLDAVTARMNQVPETRRALQRLSQ